MHFHSFSSYYFLLLFFEVRLLLAFHPPSFTSTNNINPFGDYNCTVRFSTYIHKKTTIYRVLSFILFANFMRLTFNQFCAQHTHTSLNNSAIFSSWEKTRTHQQIRLLCSSISGHFVPLRRKARGNVFGRQLAGRRRANDCNGAACPV